MLLWFSFEGLLTHPVDFMKVLVIDDEQPARDLMETIIEGYCQGIHDVFQAANLREGVELIRKHKPELVFLDIEMPEHAGTEIMNFLQPEEVTFQLVFATAYNEYALKAFEMHALDYLLKPIRPQRVQELLNQVEEAQQQKNLLRQLEALQQSLTTGEFTKIGLPVFDGIRFIALQDLIHLEADGMYTRVHTVHDGILVISKPLKFFNLLLDTSSIFYRPHRSHIINLRYLKQFVRVEVSYILLDNDSEVPLSREKKQEFLGMVNRLQP